MENKELLVGIDEFTLILKPNQKVDITEWPNIVYDITDRFIELANLIPLFGMSEPIYSKKPAGYTDAIAFDNQPFYFTIAWHDYQQDMGICVKFSAQAWASYQAIYKEQYHKKMNILKFLKMVQDDNYYTTRLSRIDLTADYKNYGLNANVNLIHTHYKKGTIVVKNCNGRKTIRKTSAVEKDGIVQTFYLGSRKENTNFFLRIYNKKNEQIENNGIHLEEAYACIDWTRFEVSYRGVYAHQITNDLLSDSINDDIDLQSYIAQKITEKYCFYNTESDELLGFTADLLNIINSTFPYLRYETSKDNSLRQSIEYILCGSGFFAVLYKILSIWNADAVSIFIDFLISEFMNKYKPNKDVILWLKQHTKATRNQVPEFAKLLSDIQRGNKS